MWRIASFDVVADELSLSSSGQERRSVTRVDAGGVTLVNAIELVDFGAPVIQLRVCETCGVVGCLDGNWVTLKRLDSMVVWVPAWDAMRGSGGRCHAGPPAWIDSHGAALFEADCWTRLRALIEDLPAASTLEPLDARDAALLAQWTARGGVLGDFPEPPRLRRERLVAVTEGDLQAAATAVDACLEAAGREPRPLAERPASGAMAPIEFWLDLPGIPAWVAFVRAGDDIGYQFGDVTLFAASG